MLAKTIAYLYPGIDFAFECRLQDDGDGQYIAKWDRPEPQPTQTEIAAAILPAAKASSTVKINTEATLRILTAYPIEKQSSANLGIYPQAYTDKMIADIAAVIAASNTACDAVDAAVDVSGVDAVVVNWPVIGA